jgi:hypothetical protein
MLAWLDSPWTPHLVRRVYDLLNESEETSTPIGLLEFGELPLLHYSAGLVDLRLAIAQGERILRRACNASPEILSRRKDELTVAARLTRLERVLPFQVLEYLSAASELKRDLDLRLRAVQHQVRSELVPEQENAPGLNSVRE